MPNYKDFNKKLLLDNYNFKLAVFNQNKINSPLILKNDLNKF